MRREYHRPASCGKTAVRHLSRNVHSNSSRACWRNGLSDLGFSAACRQPVWNLFVVSRPVLLLSFQMRRLQPVIWTKGTLLNPQHLQMQDRFLESNLEFQLNSLAFRPWGFSRLQIDQEALSNGSV